MNDRTETMRRSDCYKLLAACFYEPDKDLLVGERVCENLQTLLAGPAPDAARSAAEMTLALQGLAPDRLRIDYAALFVGPFELLAAPYGSVYLDQGRRLMGDSTLAVQRCYQDAGLAVAVGEPADHLVIELEFMYYLASREAAAIGDGRDDEAADYRERQVRFSSRYLQPWIFEFCRLIHSGTTNPFYRSLADCLGGFIACPASRPAAEPEPHRRCCPS